MMTTDQTPRTVTSHDLWAAVNTLMGRRSDDLIAAATRNPGLPSLWRQLEYFVQSGRGSAGRSRQESKPPLDVTALGLMILIADQIGLACHTMAIPRTFDANEDLRAVIRRITEGGSNPDTMAQWYRALTSWCQRIRTVTMVDRSTYLWGAPCKQCGRTMAHARDSEGVLVNVPALVVTYSEGGLVRAVECRGCGAAWMRGSAMLTLRTDNGH